MSRLASTSITRSRRATLALVAALATAGGGCATSWGITQATGDQRILDEGVREEAVPLAGLEEHLTVALPFTHLEATPVTTTAPATAPATAPTVALQCASFQRGEDAVYRSAFRYGKQWKMITATAALAEGLIAGGLLLVGDRSGYDIAAGSFLAADAVASAALFFLPRRESYRREVRTVTTQLRVSCPEAMTLEIGDASFPVDAAGRVGELGDAALDEWMAAPTGAVRVRFSGQLVELPISFASRCAWNQRRQRPEPGCQYGIGTPERYTTATVKVTPGTLTRVD